MKEHIMTAFSGDALRTQHKNSTDQIKQLQNDIDECTVKLQEVRQKRLQTEEEITRSSNEAARMLNLMKDNAGVVDVLRQLGKRLQEERLLKEQLEGPPSADRQWRDLQERSEHVKNKTRELTAEIKEVKQRLSEAEAHYKAAQALISVPTSKSKRNQRKHK